MADEDLDAPSLESREEEAWNNAIDAACKFVWDHAESMKNNDISNKIAHYLRWHLRLEMKKLRR